MLKISHCVPTNYLEPKSAEITCNMTFGGFVCIMPDALPQCVSDGCSAVPPPPPATTLL
jgi:hypothetical protein